MIVPNVDQLMLVRPALLLLLLLRTQGCFIFPVTLGLRVLLEDIGLRQVPRLRLASAKLLDEVIDLSRSVCL